MTEESTPTPTCTRGQKDEGALLAGVGAMLGHHAQHTLARGGASDVEAALKDVPQGALRGEVGHRVLQNQNMGGCRV